jgi:hypothetical protein
MFLRFSNDRETLLSLLDPKAKNDLVMFLEGLK